MKQFFMDVLLSVLLLSGLSCSSTTESGEVGANRRQLLLVSTEQVMSLSAQAYEKAKTDARAKNALNRNPAQVERVNNIAKKLIPLTRVFRKEAPTWPWEVHVITAPDINAYCMPGGKIMFYTGIIEKLQLTDGEIAAIMGHEIAHALREHGRERMSAELARTGSIQIAILFGLDPKYGTAADMASTLALSLPHNRRQESESDDIGLELMARAGYNPEEALSLWRKMAAQSGSKVPEFLSTHPADQKRLDRISTLLPKVMPLYRQVKAQ